MGAASRLPIPMLVAVGYVVVLVILSITAPKVGAAFAGIGALVLTPYLLIAQTRTNNRRFKAARTDLMPGEEVRFWWKVNFPSLGTRWAVVTTERLLIPRPGWTGMRTRSIPFAEIYLADTSQRSIGVGAYGGGFLVGTTLYSRYLEPELVNGDAGSRRTGPRCFTSA